MKIAIGSDHRGFAVKSFLQEHVVHVEKYAIEWIDYGAHDALRSDYPVFAHAVACAVQSAECERGLLVCGSGAGMSIAANRLSSIYAAVAWNSEVARAVREDDNVNILVLPSDFISSKQAREIFTIWLTSNFKEGRYQERLELIEKLMC